MTAEKKYYRTKIDIENLRVLHQRSDLCAILRVAGHLGALFVTGWGFLFCTTHGYWIISALLLLLHGTIFSFLGYAGASHEFSHNSVFVRKAPNVFFFRLFSFLVWGNYAYFSRTHTIHHRSTLDQDIDTEVPTTKCISLFNVFVVSTFDVFRLFRTIRMQLLNAGGIIPGRAGTIVIPPENVEVRREVAKVACMILFGHLALATIFALIGLWQLILLVNLAAFIGNGLSNLLASVQHCGMVSTLDYRENSRTVLLDPVIAFFYWNMNYHIEHHMYPGVPCYNLPRLRRLIAFDLPAPTIGFRGIFNYSIKDERRDRLGDCSAQQSLELEKREK